MSLFVQLYNHHLWGESCRTVDTLCNERPSPIILIIFVLFGLSSCVINSFRHIIIYIYRRRTRVFAAMRGGEPRLRRMSSTWALCQKVFTLYAFFVKEMNRRRRWIPSCIRLGSAYARILIIFSRFFLLFLAPGASFYIVVPFITWGTSGMCDV